MPDEAATLELGQRVAPALTAGLVIHLVGDLGAGKTTLVRGLLRALGHAGKVKSPTYTLVELYTVSNLNLYHFDFYRFSQPEEYLEAGLDEYFQGGGVCLVEWPDKAEPFGARPDVRIDLQVAGAGRSARLEACSDRGRACLNSIKNRISP